MSAWREAGSGRQAYRQTYICTNRHADIHTLLHTAQLGRQSYRQTCIHIDNRKAEKQTYTQAGIPTNRHSGM